MSLNLYTVVVYSKVFTLQCLEAMLAMHLCRCEHYVVYMYDRVKYSKAKVLTRLSSMIKFWVSLFSSEGHAAWQGLSQDKSNLSFGQVVSWKPTILTEKILWRMFNFDILGIMLTNYSQTNHCLGHGWSVNCPSWHNRLLNEVGIRISEIFEMLF